MGILVWGGHIQPRSSLNGKLLMWINTDLRRFSVVSLKHFPKSKHLVMPLSSCFFDRLHNLFGPVIFTCNMEIVIMCCCSLTKSCLTFCRPMDCSTPGFPVLHHLLEFDQTHVH